MSDTFVFTEVFNCAKIGKIAIESYCRHHDHPLYVFGTAVDYEELIEVITSYPNVHFYILDGEFTSRYRAGHAGTALLFASVCKNKFSHNCKRIIHFDADIFFKQECLSIIEQYLDEGHHVVGTIRCYGNNPGGVKGLSNYPDTVSTYFMGLDLERLPDYEIDFLAKMWQGAIHPLKWPVLDFGDPVIHAMMNNGAITKFLDWNEYGSQNSEGKKTNNYELNMHMDVGSRLIHFGGVSSGYSYFNKQSNPEKSYGEWSLGRYALFAKVFYNEDIGYNEPAVYGPDGRWIFGGYDDHILELVQREILLQNARDNKWRDIFR